MEEIEEFKIFLRKRNYSTYTQRDYLDTVERWHAFTQSQHIALNDGHLLPSFLAKRQVGKRTLNHDLSALRTFFKFLLDTRGLEIPTEISETSPKFTAKLPTFFTIEQIKTLLDMPDQLFAKGALKDFFWRRDKAILELLYGSGIRVGELVTLKCSDVDWEHSFIRVMGKGRKERIIPIGVPSLKALQNLHVLIQTPALIPNEHGKFLTTRSVQLIIKKYLQEGHLPMNMTPHSCRHSYATHMIQNGADLRSVQELLGHANLSTTQRYTHVNINFLKKVYQQAHPQK